jgi:GNAT superfamily N-acetyltransferase
VSHSGYNETKVQVRVMRTLEIRKAGMEDGATVARLIRASFQQQAELLHISETAYPNYVAFETEEKAQSRVVHTEVKLLFVDAVPIGTIGSHHKDEVGHIERLAVLPGHRGNDYGRILLEHAEAELSAAGCKVIHISIVADFHRLKEYYEALGYRQQRRAAFAALPFEVLFLSKSL